MHSGFWTNSIIMIIHKNIFFYKIKDFILLNDYFKSYFHHEFHFYTNKLIKMYKII